jgi:broad specificity phosphatase PhoE
LRGYAVWLPENYRVVVVVDRDNDDCRELKQRLEQYALEVGLATRSRRKQQHFTVINRIVVEELESWYFGDWQAVHAAYPRVSPIAPRKAREPDSITGGTWETFQRVLQRAGYFRTGLRKIEAAHAIAPHLDPARNKSHSFQILYQALLELAGSG